VQELVIQVAESVESRRAFMRSFVLRAAARDALVISLVGFGIALLLSLLLRPVSRLASQVAARAPSDLRALDAQQDLPRDLLPLVDAINRQLQRTRDLMARQRQFLDDASHQLRTPLATLHAQVGYAQRQQDAGELRSALDSIARQLEHATRATNQLLALARSDAQSLNRERFDLGELAREVGTVLLPLARARALDFGIEVPDAPVWCCGDRALLFEAASNLAHNAIKYTEPGGQVTILVRPDGAPGHRLSVTNTGPEIPAPVQRQLGERFVKGHGHSGSGLGLAIAKTIADRHGGRLELERLAEGQANCLSLWWPASEVFEALQEER
jgi:two-component system sensor histidine kinase TctE